MGEVIRTLAEHRDASLEVVGLQLEPPPIRVNPNQTELVAELSGEGLVRA